MKGIGVLIILGLIAYTVFKSEPVEVTEEVTEVEPSLYKRMHTTVPITKYTARKFDVYRNIDEYREANYAGA